MNRRTLTFILAVASTTLFGGTPYAAEVSDDAADVYVGRWHFRDAERKPFYIQVKPDQTVASFTASGKSLGADRKGTWELKEGRLHIAYRSGWSEVLVPRGHRFTKLSYAPGNAFDARPDGLTPAFRLDTQVLAMNTSSSKRGGAAQDVYLVKDTGF